ncbi:MAG TPA: DUF4124 domain-containing protein [Solimonas sp.]|nr:DUF4124 domain-containing protein [Solimonas sp.]
MLRRPTPLLPVLVLLPCLAGPSPVAAQVFRCQKDGVTVYSDQPCAPGARPTALPTPVVIPATTPTDLVGEAAKRAQRKKVQQKAEDAAFQEAHAQQKADETRIREARIADKVVTGMTPADVRGIYGEPTVVSRNESGGKDRETWSYADDQRRWHVTFTDGRVSAVKSRENKQ